MAEVTPLTFKLHPDGGGALCVYEGAGSVPFDIQRVFTVTAPKGSTRGNHAHRECAQLLVCVAGSIRVTSDNGSEKREFLLDGMGVGLLIPPRNWAKQEYLSDGAVLMVLCDRPYEAQDYIREYTEFKSFIGSR